MPELKPNPARTLIAALGRFYPAQPIRTLLRTTGKRFNPARVETLSSVAGPAVRAALAGGRSPAESLATIRREKRGGSQPTIVLGGYVPDAGEQVYLVRGFLARQGSVYYVDYPRTAFDAGLLAAQLEDLVAEINAREPSPPVVLAVSFGAGVVLDWLRRTRLSGGSAPRLGGILLISPVCSALDIVAPGETKPTTLLGRALKPMLDAPELENAAAVEKARAIFARMFEAGAQNKAALSTLLTRHELHELRSGVQATIAGVTPAGAMARVRAMQAMACPSTYLTPELLPLSTAPALILYAEKEGAVLSERAPGRQALEKACSAFFPRGSCRVVQNPGGAPVQHASLIFHAGNFLPVLGRFYRSLKNRKTLVST